MLAIRHATLLTPDATLDDATVLLDGGRIAAVGGAELAVPAAATERDATGLLLAPGFIDLQVNGGLGLDFTADPETIWDVAAALPRRRVGRGRGRWAYIWRGRSSTRARKARTTRPTCANPRPPAWATGRRRRACAW